MTSSAPIRIVCVGNALVSGDALGPRAFEALSRMKMPDSIELIEGGLQGLNLLGRLTGAKRIVFVDSLNGYDSDGRILVLDGMAEASDSDAGFGHSGGLAYLLRVLPSVWEGTLPEVLLVGAEGEIKEDRVDELADVCIKVATEGLARVA